MMRCGKAVVPGWLKGGSGWMDEDIKIDFVAYGWGVRRVGV